MHVITFWHIIKCSSVTI